MSNSFSRRDAQIARSHILAFAPREWRCIDGENHRESGLVDRERLKRRWICEIGDAFADLNAFHASDGDDVAGRHLLGFIALEAAEGEELGDFRRHDFPSSLEMPTSVPRMSVPWKTRAMAMRPRKSL